MILRALGPLLVLATLLSSTRAAAQSRCGAAAVEWVRACSDQAHLAMTLEGCPAGVAIVEVTAVDATPLRVELSRKPDAFRMAGAVGLSPIGDFPDWAKEPAARRAAFDALASCAGARSAETLVGDPSEAPSSAGSRRSPWLLFCASLVALAAVFARGPRRPLATLAWALAAATACLLVRRAWYPVQFFHQNGQGPLWITFAVRGDAGSYGPGYPEVFQWLSAAAPRADRALLLAQEIGAALTPVCLYSVARQLRARRAIAALLAVAVALDPILARVARSESYLATIFTLLCFSAVLVPLAADRRMRTPARALAGLGAALFVAQAARVHPLSWVPAALLPLLALLVPQRRPLREVASLTLLIAAVVAAVNLPTMLASLRGELGQGFLPGALDLARRRAPYALAAIAGAALLLSIRRARPFARPLLVATVVVSAAALANVLHPDAAMIDEAWLHTFTPVLVGACAVLLTAVPLPTSLVAMGAAALVVVHAALDRRTLSLPTDAAEQAWCLEWRERLPANAQVAWLERAGLRVLTLPFEGRPLEGRALPRPAPMRDAPRALLQTSGPRFYYRGSLCETPEGGPLCQRFEQSHPLRLVEARTFPAIASLPWLPLGPAPITVRLFELQ